MIHLECDNDETLILALGKSRAQVSHHAGKGRVSHALSKSENAKDIGLIDEDPGQPPPPYLREFKLVEDAPHVSLRLFLHPGQGKRLIEIQPDLEPWLYLIGKRVGVRPVDFNLPDNHTGLHQNAKKHRKHLLSYLAACEAAGSPHLAKMRQWLADV
ncbi:hypothetical protein WJU23_15075 [Prosthecobacter sp. SYSU 5D2]|uniref:hypothetical protein n=1 Tax=Prosthecobacter sp. SYSU 5D2 TaxID=3134134 RepID=UPI0031FE7FC6